MSPEEARTARSLWPTRTIATSLMLVGIIIAVGGAYLAVLGGSFYYLIGGAVVCASAFLLWQGMDWGAWLYAAYLAGTLIWALVESGLDAWALAPRLIGPAVIGALLGLPVVRHRLSPQRRGGAASCGVAILCLALVVCLSFRSVSQFGPPTDPLRIPNAAGSGADWPVYGGSQGGERYSVLTQLNPDNVGRLKPVWTYRTGVVQAGPKSAMEATPVVIAGTAYLCTQTNVIIALDAENGHERWRFDPHVNPVGASVVRTCRGVAYYKSGSAATSECSERIISATFDMRLIALDAHSGRLCKRFGDNGTVDLATDMGQVDKGFSYVSSAPAIVRGRVVIGGWIADNQYVGEPSGVIRAFDAETGAFAWAWDMGRPGVHTEPGRGQTYTRGTPNSWAPMSGDDALGLVYVPTGNATPDFWGRERSPASERYSSSLVALDIATGEPRWSFQTVRHDLWDYDVASQPTLMDIRFGGQTIPALIQPTKRGELFVLDRRTGKPIVPVSERPVPTNGAPGERLASTQPYSAMPSVAGSLLSEARMWGMTPIDQLWCRIRFRSLRYQGDFTPPSTQGSIYYPGVVGGVNWGGIASDPQRGLIFVNANYFPSIVQLIPRRAADEMLKDAGARKFHQDGVPTPMGGTPYGAIMDGMFSPTGLPCNQPPYGRVLAIDVATRTVRWSRPFGTTRDSGPFGVPLGIPLSMGIPNIGGAVMTRTGLTFIAATQERMIRAYDSRSGRILWQNRLPAGGQANPVTYFSSPSGRQFVLIVASGNIAMQSKLGDYVEAFALPKGSGIQ
ncbi:membrane-bound PQQ-dependent dehydrogenase, glucose/quinate/shikimate family [Sphingomonas oryzagri]